MRPLLIPIALPMILIAGGSIVLAAAPKKPVAQRSASPARVDWSRVARANPDGTLALGNPAAPIKLVEYLSFTCSHCQAFSQESAASLKAGYIKAGTVSIDYRPTVRDPVDLAATIVVKCAGPAHFARLSDEIYRRFDGWLPTAAAYLKDKGASLQGKDTLVAMRDIADAAGFTAMAKQAGVAPARLDQCFKDRKSLEQIGAVADAAAQTITGTPTFFINGTKTDAHDWATLEPLIKAAAAR